MPPGPWRAARYRRPHRPRWAPARHPVTGGPLSGGGGWPGGGPGRSPGGAAAPVALRVPAVWADVRAAVADALRMPWLGAAVAAEALCVAGLVIGDVIIQVNAAWIPPARPYAGRRRVSRVIRGSNEGIHGSGSGGAAIPASTVAPHAKGGTA
jgi:hypothetical protein